MRQHLFIILLLLLVLPSCRSHKATVVRPSANAEYRHTPSAGPENGKGKSGQKGKGKTDNSRLDVDPRVGSDLVAAVRRWLGTPYRYGGETKAGTDCSGMVMAVYRDVAGLKLPRSSAEQATYCFNISRGGLQPGDLVFFSSSRGGSRISHVGMYVGNGKIIHASTSRGVVESDLAEKYYDAHYHSSGRVYGVTLDATGGKKAAKVSAKVSSESETPVPESAPVGKKIVKEVSLDDFVAASKAPLPEQSDDRSDAPDRSDVSDMPSDSSNVSAPSLPSLRPGEPVRAAAPADSVRRADEIRRDVTKAMRFGK